MMLLNQFGDNLYWAWHKLHVVLYLPTRNVELCRKQSYRITFFVERQG